jgi:hypothetical protein
MRCFSPTSLLIRDAELIRRPPGYPAGSSEPVDGHGEVEGRWQPAGVLDLNAGTTVGHVAYDAIDDIESPVKQDLPGLQRRQAWVLSAVVHGTGGSLSFLERP